MLYILCFKTLPPWKKEYKEDIMKSWQNLWQIWPKFLITVVTTIQVTPLSTSVQKFLNHSLYRSWKDSRLAGEQMCSVFWINSAPQTPYTVMSTESASAVYGKFEPWNQESLKRKTKLDRSIMTYCQGQGDRLNNEKLLSLWSA